MKKLRITIAVAFAISGSMLFVPNAQAAPECRGATGIIRCTPDRINCLRDELDVQRCN